MGTALLYLFHGAIVENTLFDDGDGANIFCAFNPTQNIFTFENKNCYWPAMERTNILVIILLYNGYF